VYDYSTIDPKFWDRVWYPNCDPAGTRQMHTGTFDGLRYLSANRFAAFERTPGRLDVLVYSSIRGLNRSCYLPQPHHVSLEFYSTKTEFMHIDLAPQT